MAIPTCPFNPYIELMYGEFNKWTFAEEAQQYKGQWRSQVFAVGERTPLDVEIGTGNGFHFANYVGRHPERMVIGIELKYKTVIQSIRRCRQTGLENSRMLRYDACRLHELFGQNELNNVFIHFPDPWPKRRQQKNRLIQREFVEQLSIAMKSGGLLEFKTDHQGYFHYAIQQFNKSPFKIKFYSEDLHQSPRQTTNFVTAFENIFLGKGQPIFYCLFENS